MKYFIGWDVGGWNCDKNRASRDSIAVLSEVDGQLKAQGKVWRGNIREQINQFNSLYEIVNDVCETSLTAEDEIVFAIDTPLGLPKAIWSLQSGEDDLPYVPKEYHRNPYLYRRTERWLFEKGFSPLSAIKDMIGSQASKGMHILRKLSLEPAESGVWRHSDGRTTAIETYPAPCFGSPALAKLYASLDLQLAPQDRIDAVYCSLIAYWFATHRTLLAPPLPDAPLSEGWIWVPEEVIEKA